MPAVCKKISAIVFDLDGTLTDSSRDIAAAVNHTRNLVGLPPLTVHEVIRHVGLGVTQLIEKAVLANGKLPMDEARRITIDHYRSHLVDQTTVYPGINSLLETLFPAYKLAIATNKPTDLSIEIVKYLGMKEIFELVIGPEVTGKGKPDPAMLVHIASEFGARPDEVIMVGDSPVDIETARKFGCTACAVAWGYNTYEMLHEARPDFIIHSPMDLLDYIISPLS